MTSPIAVVILSLAAGSVIEAQVSASAPASGSKAPAPAPAPFALTLKGGVEGMASLRAEQVETRLIVEKLTATLGVPIKATAMVSRHRVTLKLEKVPLSQLLLALAPVVLIDIETGEAPGQETWRTIHLAGYNEAEPAPPMQQVGILIAAGNTDDVTIGPDELAKEQEEMAAAKLKAETDANSTEPALALSIRDGLVYLRARKQPVPVLVSEIAQRAGVPFDLRGDVDVSEIDIDIPGLPLDQVPAALGRPDVRMMLRRDLATGSSVVKGYLVGKAASPGR